MEIRATSSSGLHTEEEVKHLADWGFTHVVNVGLGHWETEAERCHDAGLKLIARWPDWVSLKMLGEEHAFRNHEGAHNGLGNSRVTGPSHWDPVAEEKAILSLDKFRQEGVDGILIHLMVSDRPFPGDWYELGYRRWLSDYWSFDKWASDEWADLGHGPMPEHPCASDPDNRFFYEWYRGAAFRRLGRFTEEVIRQRFEEIWTWFIPLLSWSVPNMAGGMTDGDRPMEKWRKQVEDSGRRPVNVISTLWPLGDPASRTDTKRLVDSGWDIIAGLETCGPNPFANGRQNLARAAELGVGTFAGDRVFFSNSSETEALFRCS